MSRPLPPSPTSPILYAELMEKQKKMGMGVPWCLGSISGLGTEISHQAAALHKKKKGVCMCVKKVSNGRRGGAGEANGKGEWRREGEVGGWAPRGA